MKKFIIKVVLFLLISSTILCLIYALGFILPTTPRAKKSLLFAEIYKDSLLQNIPSPRVIFVGGSNIAFGINGFMIKDSLGLNSINTGISASIGLQYTFKHLLPFIKKEDIVILVPEYHHFVKSWDEGSRELLRLVMDVNRDNLKLLSLYQIINILTYMPEYSFSKLNPNSYKDINEAAKWYCTDAFNCYGDVKDLTQDKQEFLAFEVSGHYNGKIITEIKRFEQKIMSKGAIMYISYPAYEKKSFIKWNNMIDKIQLDILRNDFKVLGMPERYMMPDSLMFDTPYHCNSKGVEYVTKLRIEDIKNN